MDRIGSGFDSGNGPAVLAKKPRRTQFGSYPGYVWDAMGSSTSIFCRGDSMEGSFEIYGDASGCVREQSFLREVPGLIPYRPGTHSQ